MQTALRPQLAGSYLAVGSPRRTLAGASRVAFIASALAGEVPAFGTWASASARLLCGAAGSQRALPPALPVDVPANSGAALDVDHDGRPVTWAPDRPIEVLVNTTHGRIGFVADCRRVIEEIQELSGLPFVFAETTTMAPAEFDVRPAAEEPPSVLVTWVKSAAELRSVTAAATAHTWTTTNAAGRTVRTRGVIRLAASVGLKAGFCPGGDGPVLRHEWGHIVGLAHVSDPNQVMCPGAYGRVVDWGVGDRYGLQRLGDTARSGLVVSH